MVTGKLSGDGNQYDLHRVYAYYCNCNALVDMLVELPLDQVSWYCE
jgi:hypothetical protein